MGQSMGLSMGGCVLVTGGTRGIGKAISFAFAQQGAQVAMVYRDREEDAKRALSELPGDGHCILKADLANPADVEQMVAQAVRQLGKIDVLVNNAGIGIYHPIATTSYTDWRDAWQKTLAVNLLGPANTCFCVAQHMINRGEGRIINVSSRGAFRGEPIKPAYGASKAALNSLTQSLADALGVHGISVAGVAPGFVDTELTAERLASPEGEEIRAQSPFNRVARPEEVAHAVLFLASPEAAFSSGTIIDVNGASYFRT